jgi:UDP-N-acetylglucosamine acyltransferase
VIHPTAIIDPKAELDPSVVVGPYAVIDDAVVIGPHCVLGPYVHIMGLTSIGAHNRFHTGCVIGDAPQDLKYKGEPTRVRIGDRNTFREAVTVNRSTRAESSTVIGSNNLLMAHSHVAHDVAIGNDAVLVNGCLLGGHVVVGDRAFLSGNCLVHQFVRVGALALMQGGTAISKDLPPFTVARGNNRICGLNSVGLRRAGFTAEQRLELRKLYRALFRGGQSLRNAVALARKSFTSEACRTLLDFLAASKRGVCRDVGARAAEEGEEGA